MGSEMCIRDRNNSIRLQVRFTQASSTVRTRFAKLLNPIETQSLLKLLMLFFGKNSHLFAISELPNSIASQLILIRIGTPDFILIARNKRPHHSSHRITSNPMSAPHFCHSLFITNQIYSMHISYHVVDLSYGDFVLDYLQLRAHHDV